MTKQFTPEVKKNLIILFFILFLDLVGFSIIFPLFPSLAQYYLEHDQNSWLLTNIFKLFNLYTEELVSTRSLKISSIVLFGGFLGSLYAFMQFLFSPFWGNLSDKIGRKKVLRLTLLGMCLSYVVWGFSGSFLVLLLGRLFSGMMAGNISVATAAVSDMTNESNRSSAMAVIGIAFALGFIIGPAIGGVLSLIPIHDDSQSWSHSLFSLNPFSIQAFFSALLSLSAFFLLQFKFVETLPQDKSEELFKSSTHLRTSNPFKLLAPASNRFLNKINYGYFLFITGFSAMEFTLSFLAFERFAFTPMNNAAMFVFIGVIITLVQGGYVRRKAAHVGELTMARHGLVLTMIGLTILSMAENIPLLYGGLFFLATGSAMIIPTLTTLASFYAPKQEQGRWLGVFRSLGSLGRVIGPITGGLLYWKLGGMLTYGLGSILILFSLFILRRIPRKVHIESMSHQQAKAATDN